MYDMKTFIRWLVTFIVVSSWVALLILNLFFSNLPEFYHASANSLLSSLIVLVVSYWLVQNRIDSRKTDDVVTNILKRSEDAFKECTYQAKCMIDAIEGTDRAAINNERQKLLSCKQKLDSHIDLLGKMRSNREYINEYEVLRKTIRKYHEKIEALPITDNHKISSNQKNIIESLSNKISTKFAVLYVTINKH